MAGTNGRHLRRSRGWAAPTVCCQASATLGWFSSPQKIRERRILICHRRDARGSGPWHRRWSNHRRPCPPRLHHASGWRQHLQGPGRARSRADTVGTHHHSRQCRPAASGLRFGYRFVMKLCSPLYDFFVAYSGAKPVPTFAEKLYMDCRATKARPSSCLLMSQ